MLRLRTRPLQFLRSSQPSTISSYSRIQSRSNTQPCHIAQRPTKSTPKVNRRQKTIPLDDVFEGLDENVIGNGKQNLGRKSRAQTVKKSKSSNGQSRAIPSSKLPTSSGTSPGTPSKKGQQEDSKLYTLPYLQKLYRGRIPTATKYRIRIEPIKNPMHFFDEGSDLLPTRIKLAPFHDKNGKSCHECNLTLSLDTGDIKAKGHGETPKVALKHAHFHAICQLEELGLFKHCLPGGKYRYPNFGAEKLKSETSAKLHVINFAARHNCLPVFTDNVRTVISANGKNNNTIFNCHASIKELGLDGYGRSQKFPVASTSACVALKEAAEARHMETGDGTMLVQDYTQLTTSSAEKFVYFIARRQRLSVDIHSKLDQGPTAMWTGELTLGHSRQFLETARQASTFIGIPMVSKNDAGITAYLACALKLREEFPLEWKDFIREMQRGRGEVLNPIAAVNVDVGPPAIDVLKKTMNIVATIDRTQYHTPDQSRNAESEFQQKRSTTRERMDPYYIKQKNDALLSKLVEYEMDPKLTSLRDKRFELPMMQHGEEVLKMVNDNQFCVVVGATGSGKTTQLPQMILDEMTRARMGGTCNIICTQPRRIAAISVAKRVAVERNEPLRSSVGYQVRFDSQLPQKGGSISYVTTGILLRKLQESEEFALHGVSHIIIDEVHERNVQIDFLLVSLKRILAERKAEGKPDIKIIMMSATIDTTLFCKYFGSGYDGGRCPHIEVPGRTFPVTQHFLDESYSELTRTYPRSVEGAESLYLKDCTKYVQAQLDFVPRPLAISAGEKGSSSSGEVSATARIDWTSKGAVGEDGKVDIVDEKEEASAPAELMSTVIAHILKTTTEGSILVFLPGLQEILTLEKILKETNPLGVMIANNPAYKLYTLHSALPQMQQEVFEKLASGLRKIILSTNIAETSVTIPDVVYVIDSNRQRESNYDVGRNMSSLLSGWTTKANVKQRAGRAGRVQHGHYYSMVTRNRYESFEAAPVPEMLRIDLKDLCLQVKGMGVSDTWGLLRDAIQPPDKLNVLTALEDLKALKALDENERLTPLGRLLSNLPLPPALGKMVVLGAIFQCLDPIIILAAASAIRDPFLAPQGQRLEARQTRRSFGLDTDSDHIATLTAYKEWRETRMGFGRRGQHDLRFSQENYLHRNTLLTIAQSSQQIYDVLIEAGIVKRQLPGSRAARLRYGTEQENINSDSIPLQLALITAGLYPNIAVQSRSLRHLRTMHDNQATIHMNSVAAPLPVDGKLYGRIPRENAAAVGTLFAFGEKTFVEDVSLRSVSKISPISVILFGGHLKKESRMLWVEDWLPLHLPDPETGSVLLDSVQTLDRYLERTFSQLDIAQRERVLGVANPSSRDIFFDKDPTKVPLVAGIVKSLELCAPPEILNKSRMGDGFDTDDSRYDLDARHDKRVSTFLAGLGASVSSQIDSQSSFSLGSTGKPKPEYMGSMFKQLRPPPRFRARNSGSGNWSSPELKPKQTSSSPNLEDIFKRWIK
ncbi:helicase associated domain-containing protein [Phlyctema vagabunda]|uniref:RNA helicase n=1 Tax=Phlyctema vagabunda TaxID=108571 RepID=A0ABR4P815_9HELO